MKKPKVKIEWSVAEDDSAWQASQSAAPTEPVTKALHRKEAMLATFIALLLLFVIAGWLWSHHKPVHGTVASLQNDAGQAEQSITQTIELPAQSLEAANLQRLGDDPLSNGAVKAPTQAQWIKTEKIQQVGDRMMAQVTVQYPEDGTMRAYRETHFYKRYANEWQRAAPDPALLGPEKTLQIANFTLRYYAIDSDAVYQAAPKIEQFYATLRRDFGVPATEAASTYTINVAADRVALPDKYSHFEKNITVSSPTLLSAPVEMSPATLLYQATVYPLTRLTLLDTIVGRDASWVGHISNWPSMTDAIALWELWQADGPLARSRVPIVRWLYQNSQSAATHQPLPDGYERLCRSFRIWQIAPFDLYIPLTCTDEDYDTNKHRYASLKSLAPLKMLHLTTRPNDAESAERPFDMAITGETLLEYVVATYGRDKVPALLNGLGEHTSFDTLIPALFSVSVADFEAGWQSYLAQRY
jgi:hypothetical protein